MDSSEEEEDSEMEEWRRVERRKRNQLKKKRSKDRKKRKQEEIANRAQRMVGLGPITDDEISKHMAETKNYEVAKVWAIKEHLANNYLYNQEELDKLKIEETKRSNKGDDILYLAARSTSDIRDIYARKAECRADNTTVKNFIPPQFYDRFMSLNKLCAGRRQEDPKLKTRIRFGDKDLKILTKEIGINDPFKLVNLREFAAGVNIPDFNSSDRWKWQEDRPPRRRVKSTIWKTSC